jgi:hypothetical protein
MSTETGVLVNLKGEPIHWHLPPGRNSAFLPDSRDLWGVIWENRNEVLGFAHSHPGQGTPYPSLEDLTTFAAVETGLGKRLLWWICTEDNLSTFTWNGPGAHQYARVWYWEDDYKFQVSPSPVWLGKLRQLSYELER